MSLKRQILNEKKIDVALLGATGLVGQAFTWMLSRHPWFRLSFLAASKKRRGVEYGQAVSWKLPVALPCQAADLIVEPLPEDWRILEERGIRIVFSALPADVAAEVEPELRERGFFVFSNASAFRMQQDVPVTIPEVNPESLALIERQGYPDRGFVVCNANCSTTGLALALAPLRPFGIREVVVSTYQSISGSGYPGLSGLDMMGNAIPYIQGEEEKMVAETCKILGESFPVFPRCVRVPVMFGHLETVWVAFAGKVSVNDARAAWSEGWPSLPGQPSLPGRPVILCDRPSDPQPRICFDGHPQGMPVWIGGIREMSDRIGFTLLVNNIVRGAAGGSIANAEAFVQVYGDVE